MDDNAPSNPGPDDAREPATAATDTRPADPHEDRGPQVAAELTRVLAAFGAASVIGGGVLAVVSEDPTRRAFGQQTAMWGAINLAIAGVGAWRGRSHPAEASRRSAPPPTARINRARWAGEFGPRRVMAANPAAPLNCT